jgi:1,4-alpha-glucan branching enzyme
MNSFGPLKRPTARTTLRAINFICNAPLAQSVSLVGDFNNWNPAAHPMKQMPDKAWFLGVELKHGHHRYAFLVDGVLTLDPRAQGITRNEQGERVCLVPVS